LPPEMGDGRWEMGDGRWEMGEPAGGGRTERGCVTAGIRRSLG
jgi:hypothetical protein